MTTLSKAVSFLREGVEFLYKGLVIAQFIEFDYKLSQWEVVIVLPAHLEGYLVTNALFG